MEGTDNTNSFETFLLKEYENIATAHFESQKQFALFFRYYTIFFSIPIVIYFYDENKNFVSNDQFGWLLIFLAVIGSLFFWYAVNLKHEAVLYAQTVNGIRNHFYKPLSPESQKQLRTLPLDIRKPSFYSPDNPVLWIITLVNVLSMVFGLIKVGLINCCLLGAIGLLFLLGHVLLNWFLSRRQAKIYPTSGKDC
jgi:hypothetical protein